jgi:hypothetical protein
MRMQMELWISVMQKRSGTAQPWAGVPLVSLEDILSSSAVALVLVGTIDDFLLIVLAKWLSQPEPSSLGQFSSRIVCNECRVKMTGAWFCTYVLMYLNEDSAWLAGHKNCSNLSILRMNSSGRLPTRAFSTMANFAITFSTTACTVSVGATLSVLTIPLLVTVLPRNTCEQATSHQPRVRRRKAA